PSDHEEWTRVILRRITTKLSFQLSKKLAANYIFTITMSGPEEDLKVFCQAFKQIYEEVMKIKQEGEAAGYEAGRGSEGGAGRGAGGAAAALKKPDKDDDQLNETFRELQL
ncbi:hypothetical protein HF521_003521, partial [Silurus meridionalis]